MTIFTTTLKRILSQPVNWALLISFPVIFSLLITINFGGNDDGSELMGGMISLGVVDQDNSVLSQTLVRQLETRFNILEIADDEINTALTEQTVPWVLAIRQNYGRDVLNGVAPVLDAYSIMVSDISMFGNITAQHITQALILLGTDDLQTLARWEADSHVEVVSTGEFDNWRGLLQFFSMYGFVSIFTASFVVKSLIEDKRNGMPQRLGILPVTPRKILFQGTLAAFAAMKISAALMLVVLQMRVGEIPNPIHLFLLLSLYNLFAVGFVLAIVSGARKLDAVPIIVSMSATLFAMLGGLFWPLEMVPPFMQRVAWFSPGYWLGRGLHNIHDIGFDGFVLPMLFLGGFTVVVLILGGFTKIQSVEE